MHRQQSGKALGGGAIAGIVIGVLAALAVVGGIAAYLVMRRRRQVGGPMQQGAMKGSKPGEMHRDDSQLCRSLPCAYLQIASVAVQGLGLKPWGACIIASVLARRTH